MLASQCCNCSLSECDSFSFAVFAILRMVTNIFADMQFCHSYFSRYIKRQSPRIYAYKCIRSVTKGHLKMSSARQSCSAHILFIFLISSIYSCGVMFVGMPGSANLFIIFLFIFRSQRFFNRGRESCGWCNANRPCCYCSPFIYALFCELINVYKLNEHEDSSPVPRMGELRQRQTRVSRWVWPEFRKHFENII